MVSKSYTVSIHQCSFSEHLHVVKAKMFTQYLNNNNESGMGSLLVFVSNEFQEKSLYLVFFIFAVHALNKRMSLVPLKASINYYPISLVNMFLILEHW